MSIYKLTTGADEKRAHAYLIKGAKNVLIGTGAREYAAELLRELKAVLGEEKIEYAVFPSAMPKYAGALAAVLDEYPDMTVIASAAGLRNLKETVNGEYKEELAKDGAKLDLGEGEELEFVMIPNMDWNDTMAVRYGETLFTGRMFSDMSAEYFEAHFRRFSDFALTAAKRIQALVENGVKEIAASEGEDGIMSAEGKAERYIEYAQKEEKAGVLVLYVSESGATAKMAKTIAERLKAAGVEYELTDAKEVSTESLADKINKARALCIGTPTVHRKAASEIMTALVSADAVTAAHKPCLVFGSYGWGGEGTAIAVNYARAVKMSVFEKPYRAILNPSEKELSELAKMTDRFVKAELN